MARNLVNCIIAVILSGCLSQQVVPKQNTSLYPGQIAIINETSDTVQFYIGEEAERLYKVTVEPGEQWVSPVFTGRPNIRIYHEEKYDEYLLVPGLFYRIYPDPRKRRPDIKMITR